MMIRTIMAVVFLVSALLTTVGAAQPEPIAVVTDLQGDVQLQRAGGGDAKALGYTTFLHAGDHFLNGQRFLARAQ